MSTKREPMSLWPLVVVAALMLAAHDYYGAAALLLGLQLLADL